MGISLFGLTPAATYPSLIKFGDNSAISGTLRALSDGLGTDLPIQVSTAGVNFTGTASIGGTAIVTNASGVSGAIQFSNGSAFASDASNFFWDNTNKRLGIGTNAPTKSLEIGGSGDILLNTNGSLYLGTTRYATNNGTIYIGDINATGTGIILLPQGGGANGSITLGASILATFKGKGSTSATTSLLVQDSAGNVSFRIKDDGSWSNGGNGNMVLNFGQYWVIGGSTSQIGNLISGQGMSYTSSQPFCINVASGAHQASASFQIDSTTKGFLPPRMTTTQRTAITGTAGLMVYDTTVNKLFVHNGVGWEQIQSI